MHLMQDPGKAPQARCSIDSAGPQPGSQPRGTVGSALVGECTNQSSTRELAHAAVLLGRAFDLMRVRLGIGEDVIASECRLPEAIFRALVIV